MNEESEYSHLRASRWKGSGYPSHHGLKLYTCGGVGFGVCEFGWIENGIGLEMADVRPFRGIRFAAAAQGRDLGDYLSPPFDMITPAVERDLLRRSEHNIVRLELAPREGSDRYGYVAETQSRWESDGVLMRDDDASVYVTEESFEYGGLRQTRRGFIAAVRLEEYDRGIIFPHEQTRGPWVEDRVKMMRATRSALSPLLVVFQDDIRHSVGGIIRAVTGGPPLETATMAGGYSLRLWQLKDPGTLEVLNGLMRDSQIFIADGHHRYEAAMRYRSAIRAQREIESSEAANYRMMHIVSIDEPGLITRGYHRVISGASEVELERLVARVSELCDVQPYRRDSGETAALRPGEMLSAVGTRTDGEFVFGIYGLRDEFLIARMASHPESGELDSDALARSDYSRLHREILEVVFQKDRVDAAVDFEYEVESVVSRVDSGHAQMGLVMRSIPMREFVDIVTRGDRLPPKATNFYPKPPAGAVIQSLMGTL